MDLDNFFQFFFAGYLIVILIAFLFKKDFGHSFVAWLKALGSLIGLLVMAHYYDGVLDDIRIYNGDIASFMVSIGFGGICVLFLVWAFYGPFKILWK